MQTKSRRGEDWDHGLIFGKLGVNDFWDGF